MYTLQIDHMILFRFAGSCCRFDEKERYSYIVVIRMPLLRQQSAAPAKTSEVHKDLEQRSANATGALATTNCHLKNAEQFYK